MKYVLTVVTTNTLEDESSLEMALASFRRGGNSPGDLEKLKSEGIFHIHDFFPHAGIHVRTVAMLSGPTGGNHV